LDNRGASAAFALVHNVCVYDVVLLKIINVRPITQWHKHFVVGSALQSFNFLFYVKKTLDKVAVNISKILKTTSSHVIFLLSSFSYHVIL
jgi:hypothetical protein